MLNNLLDKEMILVYILIIFAFFIIPAIWGMLKKKNPERMNNILFGIIIPIAVGISFLGSTIAGYIENPNINNDYIFPFNLLFTGYSGLLIFVGIALIIYGIKNIISETKLTSISSKNENKKNITKPVISTESEKEEHSKEQQDIFRKNNLLCLDCGKELSLWEKITWKKKCKHCREV